MGRDNSNNNFHFQSFISLTVSVWCTVEVLLELCSSSARTDWPFWAIPIGFVFTALLFGSAYVGRVILGCCWVQEENDEEDGVRMRPWNFLAMVVVVLPSSGVGIACTFTIRHGSSFCPYREHRRGISHR